jgi:hypothetical protein
VDIPSDTSTTSKPNSMNLEIFSNGQPRLFFVKDNVKYSDISEKHREWMTNTERKNGDVTVFNNETTTKDADGNDKVNVKDATAIQKVVAGIEVANFNEKVADVDANNKVNVKDATAIQKFVAGIETGYPIGEPIA